MAGDLQDLGKRLERYEDALTDLAEHPTVTATAEVDDARKSVEAWYLDQGRPVPSGIFDLTPKPNPVTPPKMPPPRDWITVERPKPRKIWKWPKMPLPATSQGITALSFTVTLGAFLTITEASFGRHIAAWKLPFTYLLMCFLAGLILLAHFAARELLKDATSAQRGFGFAVAFAIVLVCVSQAIGPDLLALGNSLAKSGE